MRLRAALEHFPIRLTISRIGEECRTFRSGDLAKTRGNGLAQAVDGKGSVLEGISLTLTRIDPGCAHISDPPTSRAPVDRRWASSRRAHSNVALGWPSVARVIVPVKTGLRPPPSAASVLTRDYHPAFVCHQEVDARDRWRARNRADGWVHFFEHKWVHFHERRENMQRSSAASL